MLESGLAGLAAAAATARPGGVLAVQDAPARAGAADCMPSEIRVKPAAPQRRAG